MGFGGPPGGGVGLGLYFFAFKKSKFQNGFEIQLSPPQVPLEASRGVAASTYIKWFSKL